MIINGINMPDEKDKRSKIIFDALKGENLPDGLYEQIGGWLLSTDNEQEKEARLLEHFSAMFDYEQQPEQESFDMLAEYKRRRGLAAQKEAVEIPLRRRVMARVAAVLIPVLLAVSVFMLVDRAGDAGHQDLAGIVTVSVPADGSEPVISSSTGGHEAVGGTIITVAENASIKLPDNSTVKLSKGSKITHTEQFGQERIVSFTGEAVFHIRKAEQAADVFTVNTERFRITVLGTDFKVHSFPGEDFSTVDLYHGRVMVEAGSMSAMLLPGEHLHLDHTGGGLTISRIPVNELVYDEMPDMTFRDGTLTDIFRTLETQYGVRFNYMGEIPLSADSISGDYSNVRNIDGVMRVLKRLSGTFDYEIKESEIIIKPTK